MLIRTEKDFKYAFDLFKTKGIMDEDSTYCASTARSIVKSIKRGHELHVNLNTGVLFVLDKETRHHSDIQVWGSSSKDFLGKKIKKLFDTQYKKFNNYISKKGGSYDLFINSNAG